MLLAAYTGEPPDKLQLAFSSYGKPMLRSYALRFSVSHTDELALYAVTREGSVGIDVERVAPERASVLVAGAFLSAAATSHLRSCAPEQRAREFFRLWTRREAFLKAAGTGWSAQTSTLENEAATAGWWIHELPVGAGHAAVVAVEGAACLVRLLCLELPFRDATPQPQGQLSDTRAMNHVTSAPGLQSERETPVPSRDRLAS